MHAANPRRGYILGLSAYIIWGLFPIYFKAIQNVPAVEIIVQLIKKTFCYQAVHFCFTIAYR